MMNVLRRCIFRYIFCFGSFVFIFLLNIFRFILWLFWHILFFRYIFLFILFLLLVYLCILYSGIFYGRFDILYFPTYFLFRFVCFTGLFTHILFRHFLWLLRHMVYIDIIFIYLFSGIFRKVRLLRRTSRFTTWSRENHGKPHLIHFRFVIMPHTRQMRLQCWKKYICIIIYSLFFTRNFIRYIHTYIHTYTHTYIHTIFSHTFLLYHTPSFTYHFIIYNYFNFSILHYLLYFSFLSRPHYIL